VSRTRLSRVPPPAASAEPADLIYHQLVDALPGHAAVVDERGIAISLGRAWRLCAASRCFHEPDVRPGTSLLRACESAAARHDLGRLAESFGAVARGELDEFRATLRHRGGDRLLWIRVTLRRLAGDGPARLVAIFEDVTHVRATARAFEELTERLLSSQDDERRRIARDLHDVTGQNMVAMSMSLARLAESPELTEKARRVVADCRALADESLREVRTLSYLLHPPLDDELGLVSAVRWFVGGFASRSGLKVDVADVGEPVSLPTAGETALYHVVQESLRNVYRHSGSPNASVSLEYDDTRVVVRVADRGCGIPPESCDNCGEYRPVAGVGIASMRHRIRQAGGTLEIESGPHGTTVIAAVPVVARADGARPRAPRRGRNHREIPDSLDSCG
jgi:signal transduction histidine kinase